MSKENISRRVVVANNCLRRRDRVKRLAFAAACKSALQALLRY